MRHIAAIREPAICLTGRLELPITVNPDPKISRA
jgi:hypothetical protein